MNFIQKKILIFFAIISFLGFNFDAKSQSVDDYKVDLFYKIFDNLIYPGDDVKMDYVVATYDCPEDFVKKLKSKKPNKVFSGLNFDFIEYNPNSNTFDYDMLIVNETKNDELDKIYSHVLEGVDDQNATVAIFTNNWHNKDKITFNFTITQPGNFVSFEYYLNNVRKYHVDVSADLKKLNGTDINASKLLSEAKDDLKKIQLDLEKKEIDLANTIKELDEQQEKINIQKDQITAQQKEIEDKQLEIKKQQSNLQNVIAEMYIAQNKLVRQKKDFAQKEIELVQKQEAIIEFQNKINEMQSRFEEQSLIIEQKIAENEEITKQIEDKKKELGVLTNVIELQRYALILFSLLLAIIVVLTIWIFRNFKKMKRQNIVLEQQKNEITTQSKELEKANLELEKLSIVASKTNNAVAILDKKGNFDWINSGFTKLYGYTLQLLKNELDPNILQTSLYKGITDVFNEVANEKRSISFEHESKSRNNLLMWIHSSITPILDYNGEIKKIILIDTDISEIKQAQRQIALQNKSIKNSILYASRIQKATLPATRVLLSYLPDSFVLYLPRDIVSGDFYWSYKIKDKIFFSAADCTGHGVPGAFMSMLGITLLNEIVTKLDYESLIPSTILDNLRQKLIHALRQSEQGHSTSDGIDLALCLVEPEKMKLSYSGAHNELIHIRGDKLTDYHADEMPIGVSAKNIYNPFTNTEIDYKKGDVIYVFSDGYVDQFGGPEKRKRKYMISRLRELFMKIKDKSADEQKDILLQSHLEWKGDNKQMDDILIMGVRL